MLLCLSVRYPQSEIPLCTPTCYFSCCSGSPLRPSQALFISVEGNRIACQQIGPVADGRVLSVPVTAGATRSCGLADALAHLSLAFVVNNQWLKGMGLSTRSASKN